jgi:hypothetical protein
VRAAMRNFGYVAIGSGPAAIAVPGARTTDHVR